MHVIAGKYKRRKLVFSKDPKCRPTKQVVKEAFFNIIQTRIEGSSFLDLCCGVGAIGIEAVSRGASRVVCVDQDTQFLTRNLAWVEESVEAISLKVDVFLRSCQSKFDIIYFDPPWDDHDLYLGTLKAIFEFDILNEEGVLICEHRGSEKVYDGLNLENLHHS